jgi:hypothetical protein
MKRAVNFLGAITLAIAANISPAAAPVIFELNTSINGTAPLGDTPWMTATFADLAGDETHVQLTLALGTNFDPGQFIRSIVFNFDGDATALLFDPNQTTIGDSPNITGITTSATQNIGDEPTKGGLFNVQIDFATSSSGDGVQRFTTATDPVVFDISLPGGGNIDPQDFFLASLDGPPDLPQYGTGGFYMAAKVQGIPYGTGSGSIGMIPEPEIYAMLAAGLGLMGFMTRLRKRLSA